MKEELFNNETKRKAGQQGREENGTNKLHLYKFSQDSNVVGPIQLEKQIEQDDAISKEIETLNTTGTKVTKSMIIVPIGNTILYVEPIYQTKLNESKIPLLKKVIVSSGNKIAIGDNLEKVYYMADDGEIYTEKRALDRIDMYNKNTWLNNQSVGDKIMVFGREYPIGEDGHIHVPTEDFWTSGRCNYGKAI